MTICPHDKCTGCYACANVCPKHCITMQEDEYGELHPEIDKNLCVNCGLCIKTCPHNLSLPFHKPKNCLASWITNKEKRRICASGGIATTLAEHVIKHHNGVVFGSRYDDNLKPVITYTTKLEELEHFKGSRYVQSVVGSETFKQVKHFLRNEQMVLFIGTPCQIAGLYGYLKHDYENLITVDLICHGVNPTLYFMEEVNKICTKHNIANPKDVRFRGNDGHNYRFTIWDKENICKYERRAYEQHYFAGFMLGVTLRENCFQCKYAKPERIADITIGDFIGLGNKIPFPYEKNNVSSVTLNTEKGLNFYQNVSKNTPDLTNITRTYEERLEYAPSLRVPYKRHPLNKVFRENMKKYGYIKASRKTLNLEISKNIILRKFYEYKKMIRYRLLNLFK